MFGKFFQSKEDKRILELVNAYKSVESKHGSSTALLDLWGELIDRGEKISQKYQFHELSEKAKRTIISQRFSEFKDIFQPEKIIRFIISWEFPNKYNKPLDIDQLLSGTDPLSTLEQKIKKYL